MRSIKELLQYSANRLHIGGLADPRRESVSLMTVAIARDHAFIRGHPEYNLTEDEEALFVEIVDRRAGREPFQHISGKQEFFRLDFEVNNNVLIPRHETELIVETGLGLLEHVETPQICDIGTGSGCISIALLYSLPKASATAVDISDAALAVAARNARRHKVSDRIRLVASDLYEAIGENRCHDLIVCNPPYVPKADFDGLQAEIRNFEPPVAVTDGFDGLSVYKRLITQTPGYLKAGGWLVLEIGIYQSQSIFDMFSAESWDSIETRSDLQGIPRVLTARCR